MSESRDEAALEGIERDRRAERRLVTQTLIALVVVAVFVFVRAIFLA